MNGPDPLICANAYDVLSARLIEVHGRADQREVGVVYKTLRRLELHRRFRCLIRCRAVLRCRFVQRLLFREQVLLGKREIAGRLFLLNARLVPLQRQAGERVELFARQLERLLVTVQRVIDDAGDAGKFFLRGLQLVARRRVFLAALAAVDRRVCGLDHRFVDPVVRFGERPAMSSTNSLDGRLPARPGRSINAMGISASIATVAAALVASPGGAVLGPPVIHEPWTPLPCPRQPRSTIETRHSRARRVAIPTNTPRSRPRSRGRGARRHILSRFRWPPSKKSTVSNVSRRNYRGRRS